MAKKCSIKENIFITENIFDGNPVDGFICGKCGFYTKNISRYVYDEDTDDTLHYEYEVKFCPECGRKVISYD